MTILIYRRRYRGNTMKTTLAEALGLSKRRRSKKISTSELGRLILETYDLLREEEEKAQENPEGFSQVSTSTNIASLDPSDAFRQLSSADESAPLIQAMMKSTGWAASAIQKAGGVKKIKTWAEEVGEADLKKRISYVSKKLPSKAPSKQDMPSLEGQDAAAVADALAPGGDFNVDFQSPAAGDSEDFNAWYNDLSDEDKESYEKGEVPESQKSVKKESRRSLSARLLEKKFPRDGMGPLKGAPNKGEKGPPASRKELVGRALAFLTKGHLDGSQADDSIEVKVKGTIANDKMIPTQSNILAGKSLLFGFLQGVGASDLADMGGAFVTSSGEILDGHHRWSGAYIGTGGGLTHSNVNIVNGDASDLIPMLVTIGNALGRPQKGVEKKNESFRKSKDDKDDNIVLERWTKLAGLLND